MHIDIKLNKDFEDALTKIFSEIEDDDTKNQLQMMNGIAPEQLDYTFFIDNFIGQDTVADASIDGNSNISQKDIVTLENEMSKPHSKLISYSKIYYEIQKEYGNDTAYNWLKAEMLGDFYLHDGYNASMKPYCYAYDLEDLVNKGLYFIRQFNHKPPKHLTTFVDFTAEFISWTCNRTSGAVGLPSFLIYAYYFYKNDVASGYYFSQANGAETYRDQAFQEFVYRLNQPFLRGGVQSAFTNISIFDHPYMEALFGGKEYPDGTFIIDYIDEIVEFQKAFMEVVSNIRSQNMMTFPVLTTSLLRDESGKFVDEDFAKWACRHNMKWNDSNFFVSSDITSLSNCCRLVSDVKSLGYFNSIGGTALEVGSIKVNTINLARISYQSETVEEYMDILEEKVILCLQCLDRIRRIMLRNTEKGLLPNYSLDVVKLSSQYNTIGIIGIYETLEKFGLTYKDEFGYTYYSDEGIELAKKILKKITDVKNEFGKDKDYLINIEEIPGERAAHVLMSKDQLFYPDQAYTLPLYGNQWIPLGVKTTLKEKIKLSAILDKACSGGSIAHINLDAPIEDFDTAWNLLNMVADAGVVYFAFCVKISACDNNHGFYGDTCPICGKPKTTTYQRVVGFFTPEKTYSAPRKAEFALRDWMKIQECDDIFS